MIKVKVPASTSNIGPGFDSLGLALSLYNHFSFKETESGLTIIGALEGEKDTDNLVYQAMLQTFEHIGYQPRGLTIKIDSSIPISRGLGSSSTCILAGVIGGNEIAGAPLSKEQLFKLATEIEGHPDNIAPALFGGFQISLMDANGLYHNQLQIAEGLKFIALIPDFSLSTQESRDVLPEKIPHKHAVENIGRVSLLLSALANGRFDLLKPSLKDSLHQPFRSNLVKGYNQVLQTSYENEALGVFLSGAGPTTMAIVTGDNVTFESKMKDYFKVSNYNWKVIELKIDTDGAIVY